MRGALPIPPYGGPASQTFDLSTGGDSAAGLAGTLTVSATSGWYETGSITSNFNDDYTGEINGVGDTATWTVTGYLPGTTVEVYATWRQQGNFSNSAPYAINGGTAININHRVVPTADLVLNDPAGGTEDFQLLGIGTADGSGQVQLVLTRGTTFTPVDAVAFVSSNGAVPAVPFAITEIEYDPDAEPNPTVTLTWRKTGAATYIAKVSADMGDWDADLDDSVAADRDDNLDDTDHITVTFPLEGDRADAEKLFFRIEES